MVTHRTTGLTPTFSRFSGGLGTKRRIPPEAVLHVQKPDEDSEQIQQGSSETERLKMWS